MAGVVPGDLRRLFTMVRAASSRGPAKAKLFLEDMILLGKDGYARRNHKDHATAAGGSAESGVLFPLRRDAILPTC